MKTRQAAVDKWNRRWSIGQSVSVQLPHQPILVTRTKSRAWLVAGSWPGVLVEGIAVAVSLHDVAPIASASTHEAYRD
jgi:hypothetical protein